MIVLTVNSHISKAMKTFAFKTDNNNYYLYSPSLKKFIPIPENTYNAFISNSGDDPILNVFKTSGYLTNRESLFSKKVNAHEIKCALANIPQIVFEVTTHCNFRCKYCCYGEYYETFAERKEGLLTFPVAKALLDKKSALTHSKHCSTFNSPLVLSFYGGEPLLNVKLIKDIVDYAKSLSFRGRPLRFSLTTNASLLAKNIDFLQENNFALLVSLDGDRENNSYRVFSDGRQSFDTVISNLKSVRSKYPEYFQSIRFNSVYTNLSDTENIFDFFSTNFNKATTLSPLHISDGEVEHPEVLYMRKSIKSVDADFYRLFPESFLEIPMNKKVIQLLMYMTGSLYYDESSYIHKDDIERFPTHTCVPFTKRLFLTVNNTIVPCEKVNRSTPLCKYSDGDFGFDYPKIADDFNAMVYKFENQCSNCAFKSLCNHCACTSTSSSLCPEFKSYKDSIPVFAEIFSYLEKNPSIPETIYRNIILK